MPGFIINTDTTELHRIQNQLIRNILVTTKEKKSPGAALKLNNSLSKPQIPAMFHQAPYCSLSLYYFCSTLILLPAVATLQSRAVKKSVKR